MDLNVPDFLGPPGGRAKSASNPPPAPLPTAFRPFSAQSYRQFSPNPPLSPNVPAREFAPGAPDFAPAAAPDWATARDLAPGARELVPDLAPWRPFSARDPFALPAELQGGVGTILSRRPLYAAESFTRTDAPRAPLLASVAAANLMSARELDDLLLRLSLGGLAGFQARRPLQLAGDYPTSSHPSNPASSNPTSSHPSHPNHPSAPDGESYDDIVLDNGLLLRNHYILASPDLKAVYARALRYFQEPALCAQVQRRLARLLARPAVARLVAYVKNANNLVYSHRTLCLVVNKNGKLDLLSYPSHSNLQLQRDDLVIVDGDRGKDMVMIVDPAMRLDMAVLFNFVKKTEHLKSLTIVDAASATGRLHPPLVPAARVLGSGEDNEFTILLPTKQVLRFATPKEVHRLAARFAEERRAFVTCHAKIKELGLDRVLTLINVEYQFDFKKLIFYYFGNFYRVDFRGLIKELFKIYKTRIWLCAVLPCDHPELYTADDGLQRRTSLRLLDDIPPEYADPEPFAGGNFDRLVAASYFHTRNILNLIGYVEHAADGYFYGFNLGTL